MLPLEREEEENETRAWIPQCTLLCRWSEDRASTRDASRDDSELSMDKQSGLEPSYSLPAPDTISLSTGSLVPSELSHRSLAPETSSQAESGQSLEPLSLETSSSSTTSQASSDASHDLESGRCSSSPGPVWIWDHSHLQRQAQNPHSQPGHGHWTCCAPSPNAGSDPAPPAQ
ncbi:hypothetical protein BTVI_32542 [Pitangus sulphuratus]|nr:hypothetical protein BTVI_32542 [Pitangus sulphuratus]